MGVPREAKKKKKKNKNYFYLGMKHDAANIG